MFLSGPRDGRAAPPAPSPRVARPTPPPIIAAPRGTPTYRPGQIVTRQPVVPSRSSFSSRVPARASKPAPVDYSYLRAAAKRGVPESQIGSANLKAMGLPHHSVGSYSTSVFNGVRGLLSSRIVPNALEQQSPAAEAAIHPALLAAIGKSGPGILGNFAKDVVGLPGNLLQGAETLVPAVGRDALSMVQHPFNVDKQSFESAKVIDAAVKSDPIYQAITGHGLGAAAQHPLQALLDLSGAYGLAGRGAGALARSGALGDASRAAGGTARASREVVPGIGGSAVMQHYSPNIITKQIQKAYEGSPLQAKLQAHANGLHLPVVSTKAKMRKQIANFYGPEKSRIAHDFQNTAKALASDKPAQKATAEVTPYITAFGGGRHTLVSHANKLDEALAAHEASVAAGGKGILRPSTVSTLKRHQANIQDFLAKGGADLNPAHEAAAGYHGRQLPLEAEKARLNLLEEPEIQGALHKQYALQSMPGTHLLGKDVIAPESVAERRAAGAQVREAQKNLDAAVKLASHNKGVLDGYSKATAEAARKLPLHPANDTFANHLLDARDVLEQSRRTTPVIDAARIEALKDTLKQAQADYKLVKENPKKLTGLVTEDPNAPIVRSAKDVGGRDLSGLNLRKLTPAEITAHMAAHPDVSYIRMTNPEREKPLALSPLSAQAPALQSRGTYTGESANVGDWTPGYKSMVRSQLGDTLKVGQARMERNFIDRFGLTHNQAGEVITKDNWEHARAEYEQAHPGIKLLPIPDRTAAGTDHIALIPDEYLKEMQRQLKLETPTKAAKVALAINRGFRNTVLPTSAKLPVMHTVEGLVRPALHGALPFGPSYWLARNTLQKMRDSGMGAEADHLENLATPGGLSGHQQRLSEENLGHLAPTEHSAAARAALAVPHIWNGFASKIIGAQRAIEKTAQTTALGVHMRQQLQEWGTTWAEANTTMAKYTDALAKHYATPQAAEDAANYLHRVVGQYNNFTATQRFIISRVAPFAPWYMNAAHLVFRELPTGHPLKTAILTDVEQANSKQWDAQHAGLPPSMQDYAVLGPGHYLDVGKFTPIGLGSPVSPKDVANIMLPQYQPAFAALTGSDPFWGDMYNKQTPYGKRAYEPFSWASLPHAAEAFASGQLGPLSAMAKVVGGQGSTLYNTSMPLFGQIQKKPNSAHGGGGLLGGLKKQFNPFFGTYYHGKTGGGFVTNLKGAGLGKTSGGTGGSLKGAKLGLGN